MMAEQMYLTPDEVAERFKVPRSRVIAWARTGQMHGIKVGRSWRFTEEDVQAFIKESQEGTDNASY
jgi:excisionase family DNA binding protein